MTDLAERLSLGVRELQSTFQLSLHDAVFGNQIFVPRQKLLVQRPRHVSQDARPIHSRPRALHRPLATASWTVHKILQSPLTNRYPTPPN